MKAIDRYLLGQITPTVLVTLFIAAVILCMERLMRLLDIAVGNGVSTLVVFQMLANLIPHYIGLALPAALFLGVLLAFRKLSLQSELDAILSSGVGLSRFIRSAMAFAVFMAAFNFVLSGYLQPYSRYAYRAILFNITSGVIEQGIGEGIFMNLPNGYTLRVEQSSGAGRELVGVFAHKQSDAGEITTLTAKRGELVTGEMDGIVTMRLYDGTRSEWDPATQRQSGLKFEVFDWPLDLADIVRFRGRGGDERELTIGELLTIDLANRAAGRSGATASTTDEKAPVEQRLPPSAIESELHGRIVFTLSMILLPLLGAPLGIITRRATRSFGLIFGILIMVSYHKVLEFGEAYAASTGMTAAPILWGAFAVFTAGTILLFYRTDIATGATPIQKLEEAWVSGASLFAALFKPARAKA
ncbi:MAG: LPS export ABC transporter permease LptF [Alphaproteobacteria bacterium]|nr:LPS export ABC transporter permease LptF [Alphaproteobacteria bacterium]